MKGFSTSTENRDKVKMDRLFLRWLELEAMGVALAQQSDVRASQEMDLEADEYRLVIILAVGAMQCQVPVG